MTTLIAVSALGFICLLLEIFNLRKVLVPIILIGLFTTLGLTIYEYASGSLLIANDSHEMVVGTGFSQAFSSLFILLAICIITMSPSFYKEKIEKIADYVALKIFLLAGAVAMVSFGNLIMFFLGLEVLSVAAYILAASKPTDVRSNEAGMKYFVMGAFASGFILFGIALLYGAVATFNVAEIHSLLVANTIFLPVWGYVGLTMILVGLFFKVAVFPFHFWAPDVYDGSPSIVTALMSTLIKVSAIAALVKMAIMGEGAMTSALQAVVAIISILSMTIGNITAIRQNNIKRMMAYSGISHAGFMIMPILALDGPANSVLYYAAAYSLAAMAAFAVIIPICKAKGSDNIDSFNGLAKKNRLMALIMSLALMSLSGIPILAGFFGKFFVFKDVMEAGFVGLVILGVINSVIALYYYFRVMNSMFIKDDTSKETIEIDGRYKAVAFFAIALNIILGLCPSIIMGLSL